MSDAPVRPCASCGGSGAQPSGVEYAGHVEMVGCQDYDYLLEHGYAKPYKRGEL